MRGGAARLQHHAAVSSLTQLPPDRHATAPGAAAMRRVLKERRSSTAPKADP